MVSSELETAHAVSRTSASPPRSRRTSSPTGQVQIVEFDVPPGAVGRRDRRRCRSREATIPAGLEGGEHHPRRPACSCRGATSRSCPATGSSSSARPTRPGSGADHGARRQARRRRRHLRRRGDRRRDRPRPPRPAHPRAADRVARGAGARGRRGAARTHASTARPASTPTSSSASGSAQAQRRRLRHARGLEEPLRGDAREGARRPASRSGSSTSRSRSRCSSAAGIDVAVNPRSVTAEEIVRFAHDPRIRQLAMLEGDRFEILDITVREDEQARAEAVQASCR